MKPYMNKEAMEQLKLIFRTMADPTRMAVVSFLRKHAGGCCFGDIKQEFDANNNTVSFHLKKLVAAGLVRKNGKYFITDFGRKAANVYKNFEKTMPKLDGTLEDVEAVDECPICRTDDIVEAIK